MHPLAAVQSEYSLWSRGAEREILPTLEKLGIGFVPYMPLGAGFVTGLISSIGDLAPDDFPRNLPRFQPEAIEANLRIADAVREIAERHRAAPGQVAVAWVLSKGKFVSPIFGTRSGAQLQSNIGSLDVELEQGDLAKLDELSGPVTGGRLPSFLRRLSFD